MINNVESTGKVFMVGDDSQPTSGQSNQEEVYREPQQLGQQQLEHQLEQQLEQIQLEQLKLEQQLQQLQQGQELELEKQHIDEQQLEHQQLEQQQQLHEQHLQQHQLQQHQLEQKKWLQMGEKGRGRRDAVPFPVKSQQQRQMEDTETPGPRFNPFVCDNQSGGLTKLLNGDWGEKAKLNCKKRSAMSLLAALLGAVMYISDIGADSLASMNYFCQHQSTHRTIDLRWNSVMSMFDLRSNSAARSMCIADEKSYAITRDCTLNDTTIPLVNYNEISGCTSKQVEAKWPKYKNKIFICNEMRFDWAIATSSLLFLPGITAFFKLLIEERRAKQPVHWIKKLALIFCFPFIGLFTQMLRLVYHDSDDFEMIIYSIDSVEVLTESTLQLFLQFYIFNSNHLAIRRYSKINDFMPLIKVGISIVTIAWFYKKRAFSGHEEHLTRRPTCRKRLQSPVFVSGLGMILMSCTLITQAKTTRLDFLPYCGLVLAILLTVGLVRSIIYVASRVEDDIGWPHMLYLPWVFGLDVEEYFYKANKCLVARMSLEIVLIVVNSFFLLYLVFRYLG